MTEMIQPRDFFEGQEHSLKSLLTDEDYKFIVPDYQRKYAWSKDELSKLWEDYIKTLTGNYDTNYNMKPTCGEPHFFGAIVLTKSQPKVLEITDGQQRLTSVSILLKLLSEICYKLTNADQRTGSLSLISKMLQRNDYGETFQQRLELDPTINDFFKEYILLKNNQIDRDSYLNQHPISKNSSRQNIVDANLFLNEKLCSEFPSNLSQSLLHQKLLAFINIISKYFLVLEISVFKKETAYMIFETLNKRGKDLSESDMIKNELFKSVSEDKRPEIKDMWDRIAENIQNEDLTEFIRFHYSSKYDNVTPAKLYEAIKAHISQTNALDYLQELVNESEWYARVTLVDTSHWNAEINEILKSFKSIDVSHSIPLLLSAAVTYNNDINSFKRIINNTLTFCFRFFTIGDKGVSNLEKEIGQMARALRDPQNAKYDFLNPFSNCNNISDKISSYMQSSTNNDIFKKKFSEFSTKSTSLAFYIFYTLEKHYRTGVQPLPHGPNQHVEHIMPKRPSRSQRRQNEWSHVKDDPNYKEYIDRIGNMLILESNINQNVKNKDFSYKLSKYVDSGLYYPPSIASTFSNWDFSTIETRQTTMANTSVSVWRYI